MKRLFARNAADIVAILDQVLVSVTTFLTGLLLARYCIKEEYAFYYLAVTQLPLWDSLRLALISTPLTVFLPRTDEFRRPAYIGGTFLLEFALVLIGMTCAAFAALVLWLFLSENALALVFLASSTIIAGHLTRRYLRGMFYAQLRNYCALIMNGLICILQLGGMLLLYRSDNLTAVNAVVVIACAQLLGSLLAFCVLVFDGRISFQNVGFRELWRNNWKYGHWLVWKSIVYASTFQVFPWFLKFTHGTDRVAVLGACVAIVNIVNPIWIGFSNSLGARMAHTYARKGALQLRKEVFRGQIILMVVIGFVTLAVCIFANPLLRLFFGSKYLGNGFIVIGLSVAVFLNICTFALEQALLTIEKPKTVFYTYLGVLCLCPLAGFILVYFWGIEGAAAGYIITCSCTSFFRLFFYRREMRGLLPAPGAA